VATNHNNTKTPNLILMNYDYTKKYGELVKKMAAEFNEGRDIYEAASALTKYAELNFAYSRYAYRELYDKFYPEKQETVTFVIDKYVMSDAVATAFLENLYADYKEENRFIERNIGDAYSLLRQIQNLMQGMAITSHPEDGSEELYKFAIDKIIKPVVKEAYENEDYIESILRSHESDNCKETIHSDSEHEQGNHGTKVSDEPSEGPSKEKRNNSKSTKSETESVVFQVKDENQCATVYKFLKNTAAIDGVTSFNEFLDAVEKADMSGITPGTLTKFRSAVARMKWMIKGDVDLWSKNACGSIGKTPSQAASNSTNTGKWFEDLCEIIPEDVINH